MFWSRLDNFAHSPALTRHGSADVSYGQLARMADAWGDRMATLGAQSARLLIGVEMAAHPDLIAAYLGALRGGHAVIIGAPGDFAPGAPMTDAYRPNAVLRMDADHCTLAALATAPAELHPDLCLMLSTSGTTGDPRLVRLSRRNIASNAASIAEYLALRADDHALTTLPLHYSYGLSVLHSHLAVGASIVLGDLSVTDPGFADAAARDQITGLALVPHQVELMEAQGFDFAVLPDLRRVTQAGGRLAPDAVRRMVAQGRDQGWDFIVMYGQTEAGPRMAWLPPHLADSAPDTIGQAIPGGRFWIEGPDGAPLAQPGKPGALVYQGPNVMMGYATTRADLALPAGPDILHTGDIAETTPEGLFRIVGREKRFVKLFGLRLSLDQIEARLAVAGLPAHATGIDDRLVIVARPGIAARRVQDTLSTAFGLPGTAIAVVTSDQDPRLASGKPDLRRIADIARIGLARTADSAPYGLIDSYRSATRVRRVTPQDTFLGLGGDSLAYLHVQMAIEERLGHAPDDWEDMTIAELEALVPVARPRWQRIDASTYLRVAAISCIILFHLTFWPVSGGTFMLLILVGYSLARFQRQSLADGAVLRVARSLLIPILPIYYVLIAAYDIMRGQIPPEMYLLLGNLPRRLTAELFEPYWFISLYAQIVAVIVAVAAVPALRRAMAATPFDFGLCATMIAVAISVVFQGSVLQVPVLTGPEEGGVGPNPIRLLPVVLPLVCLGWTAFFARTTAHRGLTLSAMALCAAILPTWSPNHITMIALATVLLLSRIELPLPARAARVLQHCAGATLFVYLAHNGVVHAVKHATGLFDTAGPVVSALIVLPASFALGLLVKAGYDRLQALLIRPASQAGSTGQAS